MIVDDLTARSGGATLAGSLWRPEGAVRGLVHMHPGSGPSDRDNDVLFPPIRDALLAVDVAVSAFDKRGVGGSTGDWTEAGIEVQAEDLAAGLDAARSVLRHVPVGLFGHSQGGWVVIASAARADPDFLITNSGPAVTPVEQETYSTGTRLRARGWDEDAVRTGVATFAAAMARLDLPYESGWPSIRDLPLMDELIAAGVFIPVDEPTWAIAAAVMRYDPEPDLRRLDRPILALLGADDPVVPSDRSAEVYRSTVRPDLLDLRMLAGGDHRLQDGDAFVPGYLEAITSFVESRIDPR